jgi:hypothetical protein
MLPNIAHANEEPLMLDILSAIAMASGAAIVVAVLSFSLSRNPEGRLRAAFALAAWFIVVVALGASEALTPTYAGTPGLGAAVVLPTVALCLAFLGFRATSQAMAATPLAALIALNVLRLLGVSFVLLYAADRLPAPFAPTAGWVDIFVGATALPVAFLVWRGQPGAKGLTLVWNTIGFLDLVDAVFLGATSAPGPIQIFTGPPSSEIMTSLPWLLIPGFLVPCFLAVHVVIFARLTRRASTGQALSSNPAPAPIGAASR